MTTSIRLVLFCMKGKLEYIHDIPSSLLFYTRTSTSLSTYEADSINSHENALRFAIATLLIEHEGDARAVTSCDCRICGREVKIHLLFTPIPIDKFENSSQQEHGDADLAIPVVINVWVDRHCARSACKRRARDEADKMLALYKEQRAIDHGEGWGQHAREREIAEGRNCRVCKKWGLVYYCNWACETAAYCGKECQMQDWPRHRKNCMIGKW